VFFINITEPEGIGRLSFATRRMPYTNPQYMPKEVHTRYIKGKRIILETCIIYTQTASPEAKA
jgi:hypothetical protein